MKMYSVVYDVDTNQALSVTCSVHNVNCPINPANRHYQKVLDAIIEEGAACFDGDIPAELQAAADAKLASGAYNAD